MNTTSSSALATTRRNTGGLRNAAQRLHSLLEHLWKLSGRVDNPAKSRSTEWVTLRKGEVWKLTKACKATRVTVTSGVVWLTGTPSEGDVVLRAGGSHALEGRWPYVLQSLGDLAEIELR